MKFILRVLLHLFLSSLLLAPVLLLFSVALEYWRAFERKERRRDILIAGIFVGLAVQVLIFGMKKIWG